MLFQFFHNFDRGLNFNREAQSHRQWWLIIILTVTATSASASRMMQEFDWNPPLSTPFILSPPPPQPCEPIDGNFRAIPLPYLQDSNTGNPTLDDDGSGIDYTNYHTIKSEQLYRIIIWCCFDWHNKLNVIDLLVRWISFVILLPTTSTCCFWVLLVLLNYYTIKSYILTSWI